MTKKKTRQHKPAEPVFTVTPFAALKGLAVVEPATPAPVKPAPPPPRPEEPADDLFRRAMSGVQPLEPHGLQPTRTSTTVKSATPQARPAPALPRDEAIGRKTFLQELEKLQLDVRFEDRLPEDEELRPLSGNRLRQVKRGIIQLDRQLDLHGLTKEEALTALPRFLTSARQAGEQGVLVITGQGLHSADGPVLQQAVAGWLRDQGRGLILEYAPAPPELGGSGALVVFVRPLDKPVKE